MTECIALARAHDFALDLLQRTARWPKRLRHGLSNRAERSAVDLVAALARAQVQRGDERVQSLDVADAALAEVRVLVRLATDLGFVSSGAEAHLSRSTAEIGRLVGGWLQSEAGRGGRSRRRNPRTAVRSERNRLTPQERP